MHLIESTQRMFDLFESPGPLCLGCGGHPEPCTETEMLPGGRGELDGDLCRACFAEYADAAPVAVHTCAGCGLTFGCWDTCEHGAGAVRCWTCDAFGPRRPWTPTDAADARRACEGLDG